MVLKITEVLDRAQNALTIDQNKKGVANTNIPTLNGRNVAIVAILGASSVIALTAAVVAAVFAYHAAAAILVAVCAISAITAVVASQINVSQKLLDLIDKLSSKISNLNENNKTLLKAKISNPTEQLDPQNQAALAATDTAQQEEIERLKQELDQEKQSHALAQNQANQAVPESTNKTLQDEVERLQKELTVEKQKHESEELQAENKRLGGVHNLVVTQSPIRLQNVSKLQEENDKLRVTNQEIYKLLQEQFDGIMGITNVDERNAYFPKFQQLLHGIVSLDS